MLDSYNYGAYTNEQALAVATLMRDCAVASNMEYGGSAEGGSGAFSQDAAVGMRTYFGFANATCVERDNYYGTKYYSDAEWMDMVYTELNENGPLYYGGADSYNGGHAFVIHGYDSNGKVYVNWGWSGDDDGYYDISLLNPSYYEFSIGQDMITGIKGAPRNLLAMDIQLASPGQLSTELNDTLIGKLGTLKLSGDINSSDLLFLRRLAGTDEYSQRTDGYLQRLDLSDARIVAGGKPYLVDGSHQLTTALDSLPSRAFYNCRTLKKLILPAGLRSWGDGALALCPMLDSVIVGLPADDADFIIADDIIWTPDTTEIIAALPNKSSDFSIPKGTTALHDYALAGCSRLSRVVVPNTLLTIGREAFRMASSMQELRIQSKEIPTLTGADVFTDVNVWTCRLCVPSGMKAKYAQKAQWNLFKGSDYDNIVEYGSSIKVRNAIRYYGQENPTFIYTVVGDPIEGEPELTCEATPESPAGRYAISVGRGTITDEMVELNDGYLIVQKQPATATVVSVSREEGQPNPEFTLTYDGLVNNDTVPVWLVEPVITTTADENSPVGEYPIIVESADAQSYKLTFVAGVLTVTESTTAINTVRVEQEKKAATFDLQGRKVTGADKHGIYIRNGRKVVR